MLHEEDVNQAKNNFSWRQISALAVFLLTISLWGVPLIDLSIHYFKWKSHQINEYNMEIAFIGDGFIKNDFFEPIMNRPVIYNSIENPVDHLYRQALQYVFILCSNYTEFDSDYHYPEQVGCADSRNLQIITVINFEIIASDEGH